MFYRSSIGAIALAALCIAGNGAQAQDASKYDPSKYPDWSGLMRWTASGGNRYDQTKPPGRGQQAPLTAEYQAIFEAGLKDQAEGGQGETERMPFVLAFFVCVHPPSYFIGLVATTSLTAASIRLS